MAAYNIEQIKDKKKLVKLANYGTAERRNMRPKVLIGAGKEKPFIEGDILDANATLNLIEDTYDKGRIFRSFSKEGKKIDKEIKELLEKTNENYEQLSSAIADNKEDADQKIDQLSSKVDNIESNIPNLRRVVDIQLQSVLDGTKTYLVTKQGDVQEQIQISDGEKGEQGEKGDPFTYEDFTPEQIEGLKVKGDRGVSISSLEQTQTAYTSGGVNEFTITLDDGTVSKWYVRNGQKGDATKIWVNANTVHSGYYDSDDHEIKLLNADGGIMSIIDATAFIKDGMISDAYVENGYIVIVFNTDAGQTPIMIPVTDIFDADDYYTKLDTDARIAEDVLVETQRAEAAELQLTDDLAQEVSDRQSGDTTLDTKIETETTRATTAEGLLDQRITSNSAAILTETTRATNAEEALSDAIDAEESTRIQEIDDLQDLLDAYIQSNDAAVQAEISRATGAESTLQQNITAEETRATTAEQANATAISTETSRAQSAELALLGAINTEASTRAAAITAEETRATTAEQALQDNIDAEEQRAIAAELDLLDAIDAVEQGAGQDTAAVEQALNDEISRATLAEQLISSNLSAEITRATNADNANSTAISNEVSRATTAEQQNASDIDAIEALIPSLATSSNQLADKAFVNSSIATSTATFVGTFNDITDLYAVTTADANDYGYVITTDSAGNTKYNRYKYDGSQWDFEYALNNSSFTAEEWAAIQSGMTQALRIKLENLPSTAVTSVGVSVPTGLTVTDSPITSSGTIAINFTSGYSIPTTSSLNDWDTAYGWGNHANANYVKSVKVGTTAYNPSSGVVSLPAYPTKVSQLTNDSGYITSYTDTKNTTGTTNKTATKMFLVGATSQAANPQTYSNSNVYIGTDNCLYSNGTKVLTSHQSLSNYVKLDPGTTEQTIKSSIGTISKGVINLWRSSGNHVTFLGFSNGTTETYLGGIGFKSQEDTNLYHRAAGGSSYKIWDENNDGASSGLDADLLDGYHASSFPLIRNINDSAGDAFADVLKGYSGTFFFYGNNLKGGQNDWVGLQIGYSADKGQIIFENGTLSVRHNDSGGTNTTDWSDWEKLARITDNVASATKLQTARTLWGQSFNGTANVSGNLYMIDPNAANINVNSAKLKFNSYDSDETRRSPYIQALQPSSDYSYGRKRLGFFTSNAANYTDAFIEALSIMPDGKIGIGTTEPTYKLHVAGTGNVIGITPSSDATYTGIIYNAVTDGYVWSFNTNKDKYYIWNGNLNREVFGISNAGTVQVNLPTIACSTAVGTAAKVATINGYTLATGNIVKIKFTKGNTSTSATLNISSTGAKNIRLDDGTAIASDTIAANDIVTMVYDGTYYRIKGINTDITDGYAAFFNGNVGARAIIFHDSSNGRIFSISGGGTILLKAPTRSSWAGGFNTYTHDGSTCLGGFGYYGTENVLNYLYVGAAYDNPWVTFLPSGDVGIGTTEPAYKLDVQGTLGVNGSATIHSWISVDRVPYGALPVGTQLTILSAKSKNAGTGNYTANTVIATFGSGETGTTVNNFPVRIGSTSGATWISAGESGKTFSDVNTDICNTENLYLTADGNMLFYAGLANDSTNYASKLVVHIDGTNRRVAINKSSASYPLDVSGNCGATNFYTTSDLSKKDNITSLSEHIRKFTLKETGKEHYGVIAQEVEEMFREGEEGSYTVNYNSILSYYVGLLENRVAELENKIKELSHG